MSDSCQIMLTIAVDSEHKGRAETAQRSHPDLPRPSRTGAGQNLQARGHFTSFAFHRCEACDGVLSSWCHPIVGIRPICGDVRSQVRPTIFLADEPSQCPAPRRVLSVEHRVRSGSRSVGNLDTLTPNQRQNVGCIRAPPVAVSVRPLRCNALVENGLLPRPPPPRPRPSLTLSRLCKPEVAGSIPARSMEKGPAKRGFRSQARHRAPIRSASGQRRPKSRVSAARRSRSIRHREAGGGLRGSFGGTSRADIGEQLEDVETAEQDG